jgi:DNA gyrase subunit B
MLSSKEVGTLIQAMGTGIGREDFNIEKLRYHKIVIMTDADVDGSHIRTLLLTFFYRQMPEIIENGHLFIAQPPLYKVAKGRSEIYVKDDKALDDHLAELGLNGVVLEGAGGQRAGADLGALVDHARRMRSLMAFVPRRYDPTIVEAMALTSALDPEATDRTAAVAKAAAWMAAQDVEGKWSGRVSEDGGYHFERLWRGVTDHHIIEAAFLMSAEARKLHKLANEETASYETPARLVKVSAAAAEAIDEVESDEDAPDAVGDQAKRATTAVSVGNKGAITRPSELLEAILIAGRKGLSISRYKGLGEMNAEQLWETTLDPNHRSLLRVEIDQADLADDIFTKLMGEVVEPRRDFIVENALNVANLDV